MADLLVDRGLFNDRDAELIGRLSEDELQVWADWLIERGDPDGPRVVLAVRLHARWEVVETMDGCRLRAWA